MAIDWRQRERRRGASHDDAIGAVKVEVPGFGVESQLFGIPPTHLPALTSAAVAIALAAAVPCLIVSRRATRIDPVRALRSESR